MHAHHNNFGVDGALAELGHTDGRGQQGVDARVSGELCREGMAAGRAGLLALCNPLVEAPQAKVMLARRLQDIFPCHVLVVNEKTPT